MLIKRVSPFTGIEHEMELDITEEHLRKWNKGMSIQDAMPHLSADEREFLKTGIYKDEWEKSFGGEYE